MNNKRRIRSIIVEDELLGIENLKDKIQRNCPHVDVIECYQSPEEAIIGINRLNPDLVFLDIELGTLNGFDVLNRLKHITFEVIFTTSHSEYVIPAIRASAIDFLPKPIREAELVDAVNRAWEKLSISNKSNHKIAIPIQSGFRYVSPEEIIYCEAQNNKTKFFLKTTKEILIASKTLKKVEDELLEFDFIRIHRAFLINRMYIREFHRTDGGYVIMSDGARLDVSRKNFHLFKNTD